MQLTIDIKDSAYEKVMYLINNLKNDIKIISSSSNGIYLEEIGADDSDYGYVLDARQRRANGEVCHTLEAVIDSIK